MVTSYIKGTAVCIFTHIHLKRGFGIYILTPVFCTPIMMNPCVSIVKEEPSFPSVRLRVQYHLQLLSLKFEITNHVRQDEEILGDTG